ncbi:MAG: hypothetical protein WBP79_13265 [Candidatus Acidiferrales bacterium]
MSSDRNKVGDTFTATLDQPLVVEGWVVARRGQTVLGRVATAEKAGRVKGVSQLGVELSELTLVDGQVVTLKTRLVQSSGGTSNGRDAVAVGTTTGVGAAIGAAAGGGTGAGIGAGAGAVAGLIGVLTTRGRPTVIYPESLLTFRLGTPVSFSTAHSQMAFQPVAQEDYAPSRQDNRRRGYVGGRPYPPPYYPYAYGYPDAYPYFYGGFYPAPIFFGVRGCCFGPRFGEFGRGRFLR